MNNIKKYMTPILLILLLGLVLVWVLLLDEPVNGQDKESYYHIVAIGKSSNDPIWKAVENSIVESANSLPVALEVHAPRYENIEEVNDFLDMAILSQADGIIIEGSTDERFISLINNAEEQNIPVITIIQDSQESQRHSFIGANNYAIGEAQAKMLIERLPKGKVAVIRNDFVDGDSSTLAKHAQLNGALSVLNREEGIEVVEGFTTEIGGKTINEVFNQVVMEDFNAILVLDAQNTLEISRLIVKKNLVGNFTVIGFGGLEGNLSAIRNGVIEGTVDLNTTSIGINAISNIVEILQNEHPSTYVDTGIIKWTKETILERELLDERID